MPKLMVYMSPVSGSRTGWAELNTTGKGHGRNQLIRWASCWSIAVGADGRRDVEGDGIDLPGSPAIERQQQPFAEYQEAVLRELREPSVMDMRGRPAAWKVSSVPRVATPA